MYDPIKTIEQARQAITECDKVLSQAVEQLNRAELTGDAGYVAEVVQRWAVPLARAREVKPPGAPEYR